MTLPSPSQLLGINPTLFPTWYKGQDKACSDIMSWFYSPQRFLGLSAATGTGKTTLALLAAKLSGTRTIILTATKGLQEQYMKSAAHLGAVLVKGQNNFKCTLVPSLRADEAPCHEGMSCPHPRAGTCAYRAQLQAALSADIVITNYAYYLAQTNFSAGLGEFGLLILDEGHLAFTSLESFLTIYLPKMETENQGITFPNFPIAESVIRVKKGDEPSPPDLWSQWQSWASCAVPTVEERVQNFEVEIKDHKDSGRIIPSALAHSYRTSKSILAKLKKMSGASGDWIIQRAPHGFVYTPRWVASYSSSLFQKVPKVMLMSAILSRKTADYLGVPGDPEQLSWLEVPSHFPAANTPIWHIPTARINFRTDDYGTTIWQARIDQIIDRRLDRKGIIFTVSYERARLLLSRSRHKDIMLTHSTGDVTYVVDRFKAMKPPAILVSPSVTTGYDFPGDGKSQYIIVGKLPYPDTRDTVTQARHTDDKNWTSYKAMETLIQECGRMTRASGDKTEVLVVDDNFIWWWPAYKQFAPGWFHDRVKGSLACVPEPTI